MYSNLIFEFHWAGLSIPVVPEEVEFQFLERDKRCSVPAVASASAAVGLAAEKSYIRSTSLFEVVKMFKLQIMKDPLQARRLNIPACPKEAQL